MLKICGIKTSKSPKKQPLFKNKLALTQKTPVLTYHTQYTKMFLEIWATFLGRSLQLKTLVTGSKMLIFVIDHEKNQRFCQRFAYNFLLKQNFLQILDIICRAYHQLSYERSTISQNNSYARIQAVTRKPVKICICLKRIAYLYFSLNFLKFIFALFRIRIGQNSICVKTYSRSSGG